uniref:Cytochrome P450 n=1 Tax=Rhodonia placenta TaxID=104341 RepID=F1SY87_9APHY|nr:cytochrome P450 [Postia placenta]
MLLELTFGVVLIYIVYTYLNSGISGNSNSLPLPPGPRRRWLIGNLLDLPKTIDWGILAGWKDTYGEMTFFTAFGHSILVLNSLRVVDVLLSKRGDQYSHRPRFVMGGELVGLNKSIALMDNGRELKELRRLSHRVLTTDALRKHTTVHQALVEDYMRTVVQEPDNFLTNLRLALGRMVLVVAYGLTNHANDNKYIQEAEDVMELVGGSVIPGAYMVDIVPMLRYIPTWLPFVSFHRQAQLGRKLLDDWVTRPFEHVKRQMECGNASPSFLTDILENETLKEDNESNIVEGVKWAAATMYGAGVDTSHATVATFFLLMALHPDVQVKAQAEIDKIVYMERHVTMEDKAQLPYVQAVIAEVMRWHAVVPLGIPHRTAEEDVYEGYRIPAGTIVVPNIWAIARGEGSHAFVPERFLGKSAPIHSSEYVYGFGRRICPGRHMADNAIFLIVANILALFDIRPQGDAVNGKASLENVEFQRRLVSGPEKFQCSIRPRSRGCAQLAAMRE